MISEKLTNTASIDFDGAILQIFLGLSTETLAKKRALKPVLDHIHTANVQCGWSFPACLICKKNGCILILRLAEDLQDFCSKLDLTLLALPGWRDQQIGGLSLLKRAWQKPPRPP